MCTLFLNDQLLIMALTKTRIMFKTITNIIEFHRNKNHRLMKNLFECVFLTVCKSIFFSVNLEVQWRCLNKQLCSNVCKSYKFNLDNWIITYLILADIFDNNFRCNTSSDHRHNVVLWPWRSQRFFSWFLLKFDLRIKL